MGAATAILMVFVGCCSNVVFLEFLVQEEPACGNLITFAQFLFIAFHGFVVTMDFGRKKNAIPIKEYLILVVMFFLVNVTNNMAFGFKISMPLHIIFRSGGLIASLVMGVIVLGRKYTVAKYLSVFMITAGTITCTFASAEHVEDTGEDSGFVTWLSGIAILTFALFLSARMGIYQECLYTKHGKHPHEALFFIHTLSLPGFLVTAGSILDYAHRFSKSAPLPLLAPFPVLAHLPRLWIYLAGNVITQYLCVGSVFRLTSEATALAVTLVLTLRKFLSLVFSIIYFQNPFTLQHWAGTFLVFTGTLLFTDVIGKVREALSASSSSPASSGSGKRKTN